jgi:prenylcysteine oxidase/farnesylcysteine lyase
MGIKGSTAVHPYDNDTYPAVELGGSIFIKANRHMWRASEEFNLTRRDFSKEGNTEGLGVWDGQKLLFSLSGGWLDTAKVIWRYGITSPMRTDKAYVGFVVRFIHQYSLLYSVKTMVQQIGKLYTADTPRFVLLVHPEN